MKTPFLLCLLALACCHAPTSQRRPLELTTPADAPTTASLAPVVGPGSPTAHAPSLRAVVRAPSQVSYVYESLSAGAASVSVSLTNTGTDTAAVPQLRMSFTAVREGVSFSCPSSAGAVAGAREASTIPPGRALLFERELDCSMPLPGLYAVTVYVSTSSTGQPWRAGAFEVDVVAGARSPRAYASRPGLFVAMTGAASTRPMPPDAWARGDYRVVVGVVNAGRHIIAVGPARAAFLTYKQGSPLPCSGQESSLALPDELGPGQSYVVALPVACAPSTEGQYEIVGHFILASEQEDVEMGRVGLRVTSNPLLYNPQPWSFWDAAPRAASPR